MLVHVNGDAQETFATTVGELLRELGIDTRRRGCAVAVNASVIPHAEWDEAPLREDDRVEVIRPVQGG